VSNRCSPRGTRPTDIGQCTTSENGDCPAGRLARRSPEQIAKAVERVVALVKKSKDGLRSEQIRAELKLDKRELPRVLGEGLTKKVLKSKGQKRATRYFHA
jgi:hypothetical protein